MITDLTLTKDDQIGLARLQEAKRKSTTQEVGWPLLERSITPDTPEPILSEISHSPKLARFKEELIKGAQARQALMILRQKRINEANSRIGHSAQEGIGHKIASIDPEIYFQQMQLHGQDCWQQPDFMNKFLRDNPACRIKCDVPLRVFGRAPDTSGPCRPEGRVGSLSPPRAHPS